jgi:hypothetical protein
VKFLVNMIAMFALLPWWGSLLVVAGLVLAVLGGIWWLKRQFHKIVEESILNSGAALQGARVDFHGIRAVPAPVGPSPYDAKEGDEDFIKGVDDEDWSEPGVAFYELDVTVSPTDPEAEWSPDGLSIVPADWVPEEKTDICERMGAVHTVHLYEDGRWVLGDGDNVAGKHRVKMLFGFEPKGDKAVRLRNFVTPVGETIPLPAPHPSFAAAVR